jgi:hypothetical protein
VLRAANWMSCLREIEHLQGRLGSHSRCWKVNLVIDGGVSWRGNIGVTDSRSNVTRFRSWAVSFLFKLHPLPLSLDLGYDIKRERQLALRHDMFLVLVFREDDAQAMNRSGQLMIRGTTDQTHRYFVSPNKWSFG